MLSYPSTDTSQKRQHTVALSTITLGKIYNIFVLF